MSPSNAAMAFFDACETGKGWQVCREWCTEGATFSCQADALAEITTPEGYTEWTKGILTPIPDGHYELRVPYHDPRELIMDLLKYGPEVEVLAPEALRQAVAGQLRAAVALYGDD